MQRNKIFQSKAKRGVEPLLNTQCPRQKNKDEQDVLTIDSYVPFADSAICRLDRVTLNIVVLLYKPWPKYNKLTKPVQLNLKLKLKLNF